MQIIINNIAHVSFVTIFCVLAWQDVKTHEISAIFLLIPAVFSVLASSTSVWIPIFYLFALLINTYLCHEKFLGNGDIDIIGSGMLFLDLQQLPYWLFFASLIALVYSLATRQGTTAELPFVPSLLGGYLLTAILL